MPAHSLRSSIMRWLALPAAVVVLWVHSYFAVRMFSHDGRVLVLVVRANGSAESWLRLKPPTVETWEDLRPNQAAGLAGVQIVPGRRIARYEYRSGTTVWLADLRYGLLAVPYWLLLLAAAVPATLGIIRGRRQRLRMTGGRCLVCGYDLRASRERCPECGTANPALARSAPRV
jgi:hypothetical protein